VSYLYKPIRKFKLNSFLFELKREDSTGKHVINIYGANDSLCYSFKFDKLHTLRKEYFRKDNVLQDFIAPEVQATNELFNEFTSNF
jgi:hypothetical protein